MGGGSALQLSNVASLLAERLLVFGFPDDSVVRLDLNVVLSAHVLSIQHFDVDLASWHRDSFGA
jgi:hypothetical protein